MNSDSCFCSSVNSLRGLDRYSSVSSRDRHVSELYRFSIKNVSQTGIIDFGRVADHAEGKSFTHAVSRKNANFASCNPGTSRVAIFSRAR